jgi:tetratricopeptide (TPR) repeat protein
MSFRGISAVMKSSAVTQRSLRALSGTVLVLLAFLPAILGCGEEGPKLSDSATYLIEARRAYAGGNLDAAITALTASIESQPNEGAYLERARIYATQGKDAEAQADCEALLKLRPDQRDVPWIQGELKKPVDKRFKGAAATPPSANK